MAIYRNIQMSFWTDSKVTDDFTPEDKFFYLYLFTNPHTNLCGCYEVSTKLMAYETGYSKETIERLIERFVNVHKVIDYSKETKEVLLINWHKYNWTKSEKFRKPLSAEITLVRCEKFKEYLVALYNTEDTVSIPYRYGIDTTVTDTDTVYKYIYKDKEDIVNTVNSKDINIDINNTYIDKPVKKNNKFIPPTVDEVKAYCIERQNYVDAEMFIDFYESKGWMVGKNKMKDWKAAVRTWERSSNKKPRDQNIQKPNRIEMQLDGIDFAPPNYGLPKEWFEGDRLIEERMTPILQPALPDIGMEEYEYSVQELKDKYELRRQAYEQNYGTGSKID